MEIAFEGTAMFCFREFLLPVMGLFDWGYARTQIFFRNPGISTVSHYRDTEMKICYRPCPTCCYYKTKTYWFPWIIGSLAAPSYVF